LKGEAGVLKDGSTAFVRFKSERITVSRISGRSDWKGKQIEAKCTRS